MKNLVNIRITNKCSNDCMFCLEQDLRNDEDSGFDKIVKIIKEQYRDGVDNELIIGGGSPVLRKDLVDIVEFSRRTGYNKIRVIFNGNFEESEISREDLKNSGITDITLLAHSNEENIHDRLCRRKSSFSELIESVDYFSGHLDLRICVCVNSLNIEHLPSIVSFFLDKSIRAFDFLNYFPVERAYDKFDKYLSYDIRKNFKDFQKTFKLLKHANADSWWNRFPEYVFENYEFLIPRKENIRNEITGDEYKLFEKHLLSQKKLPCFGRCESCFLKVFCEQLFDSDVSIDGFDNTPICQGGSGKFDSVFSYESRPTLETFFDIFLEKTYRLKSVRCQDCKFDKTCKGIHIEEVRKNGFTGICPK
jgi:MoaA/NifB/PqqE/SkfB family radical SAM enzyme